MNGSEDIDNQDYIINEHNKYLDSNNCSTTRNIYENFTDGSYQDFPSEEDNGCGKSK